VAASGIFGRTIRPGLQARFKHLAEAFVELGSLRASVCSLELGLYTGPKRKGIVVALSAEIGDLNVARPAVLSWSGCEGSGATLEIECSWVR
jgi:hypothetical protein